VTPFGCWCSQDVIHCVEEQLQVSDRCRLGSQQNTKHVEGLWLNRDLRRLLVKDERDSRLTPASCISVGRPVDVDKAAIWAALW
jgi:hypothetical protein